VLTPRAKRIAYPYDAKRAFAVANNTLCHQESPRVASMIGCRPIATGVRGNVTIIKRPGNWSIESTTMPIH
jgi:hypothetical protein